MPVKKDKDPRSKEIYTSLSFSNTEKNHTALESDVAELSASHLGIYRSSGIMVTFLELPASMHAKPSLIPKTEKPFLVLWMRENKKVSAR